MTELDAGTREPGEGTNPSGRPWSELSPTERREVVDRHRLAYVDEAPVNWCPGLGTVLANEEVTAEGRSDRGNFPVFRRPLKQWKMRITAYADRLLADLDRLDWPEPIKLMQRNWIGRSEGARITFPVAGGPGIEVFTTRPDTTFGATYMVLAPEHPLVDELTAAAWPDGVPASWTGGHASPAEAVAAYRRQAAGRSEVERQAESREKTGVFVGRFATNPATGGDIPVFIADYVLMGYGTGAIMAVPGQDERDWEFAENFDLPIVRTVQPPDDWAGKAYVGEGPAINSANDEISLDGLGVDEAKHAIIGWLEARGLGAGTVTTKLRDWLFSRQRFWGEPFPIVYDPDDGLPRAVPESHLPVVLPHVEDYAPATFADDDETSEPVPPLARATDWVTVELDLGEGEGTKTYRRETNTMPQWAGSCWYELRYVDPDNDKAFVDPENERYWMGPRSAGDTGGVDLYVGGAEHAVLHLLYARFWHKVLFDLGHVSSAEPYRRLFNQGMIQAVAYKDARGQYVEVADVVERDGGFWLGDQEVTRQYGKMGKSLRNSVTPDEMYESYGADTLRLYEMFTGPLDQSRPWETKAVVGVYRLLQRIWRNVIDEDTGEVTVSADAARRRDAAGAAPHHRRRAVGHGEHAVQRVDRQDHRAEQPPDHPLPGRWRATDGGRAAGAAAGSAGPPHGRGAVVAAGPSGLAGHGAVPRGRPRLPGRRHGRGAGPDQRQDARKGGRPGRRRRRHDGGRGPGRRPRGRAAVGTDRAQGRGRARAADQLRGGLIRACFDDLRRSGGLVRLLFLSGL